MEKRVNTRVLSRIKLWPNLFYNLGKGGREDTMAVPSNYAHSMMVPEWHIMDCIVRSHTVVLCMMVCTVTHCDTLWLMVCTVTHCDVRWITVCTVTHCDARWITVCTVTHCVFVHDCVCRWLGHPVIDNQYVPQDVDHWVQHKGREQVDMQLDSVLAAQRSACARKQKKRSTHGPWSLAQMGISSYQC